MGKPQKMVEHRTVDSRLADITTIYGLIYEDGEWKSRTNRELEEMSKGENIVK
jgi:hypothetical protein